jgi:lipoate-protein ligase A
MRLAVLPSRRASAAENMAIDFLMLQRYPDSGVARFRHYGWHRPAWTFGYSQKIAFVREQLSTAEPGEQCRRQTGGGIVDHREDWTYALVIPRGHALEEQRATESYRAIHECLAAALQAQGVNAAIKPCASAKCATTDALSFSSLPQKKNPDRSAGVEAAVEGVCFQRAEVFDVVHAGTGEKIAGAAQKRNKHGLLFQGSIWRPAIDAADFKWESFEQAFSQRLAATLQTKAVTTPWPEFNEDEVSALVEQYSTPDWIELR